MVWTLFGICLVTRSPSPGGIAFIPASVVLQRLHDAALVDHLTLGWLMGSLRRRSFGIIMLLLAVVAMAPGVSMVAGLLLMILAFQMIADRGPACPGPSAPHRRPSLVDAAPAALVQRAVPLLRYIENVSHPSWHSALEATKRLVGIVIFILNTAVVFTPILLSNAVPARVREEDGLLLMIALLTAVIVLTVASVAVWPTVLGAKWISGLL
jgi:hypothetical protein